VITYYLKVMWLSALVGHTVKLALLANLSPPHPSSHGISVPLRVWKAQRLVSVLGFAVLTFLVGSSLFYMLLQWRVWINIWPYWWMMACILANFAVALVSFVLFTFIKLPPLSTPFIEDHTSPTSAAATKPGKQPQHSTSSTAKPPAVFPGPSLKPNKDQQLPSPPAAPPTPGGFNPWGPGPAVHADQQAKQQPAAGQYPPLFSPFEQHQRQQQQQNTNGGKGCDAAAAAGPGVSQAAATGGSGAAAHKAAAAVHGSTQQQTKPKGSVDDKRKHNCCQKTGAALVAAGRWLRARPAWFRTAVLEEEGVR
jgi:hypothetical protein